MCRRLAHEVKIQKIRVRTKPIGQKFKFFARHIMLFSRRSGAKRAREIADIGDFQIDLGKHGLLQKRTRRKRCRRAVRAGCRDLTERLCAAVAGCKNSGC